MSTSRSEMEIVRLVGASRLIPICISMLASFKSCTSHDIEKSSPWVTGLGNG